MDETEEFDVAEVDGTMSATALETQLTELAARKRVGMKLLEDVYARYPIIADVLHTSIHTSIVELISGRDGFEAGSDCVVAVEPVTGDQHGVSTGHMVLKQTDSGRCLVVLGDIGCCVPWRKGDRLLTREQLREVFALCGHTLGWIPVPASPTATSS